MNKMRTEVQIIGMINESTAKQFLLDTEEVIQAYCDYLDDVQMLKEDCLGKFPPITIEISSQGGSTMFGNIILDRIEEMQAMGIKIDTYTRGMSYSMAFIIFLMGEERFGGRWSSYMNHSSSGMENGYCKDMLNNLNFMQQIDDKYDELILKKTRMTKDRLEKGRLMCDWINYEEAIELGIINVFDEEDSDEENNN